MLYPDKDFIVHFLGFSHSNVKPIFCSAVPISGDSFSSFVDQDARMQARLGWHPQLINWGPSFIHVHWHPPGSNIETLLSYIDIPPTPA